MRKRSIHFLIFSVVVCFPAVCMADSVTMNGITLTLTSTNLTAAEGGNSLTLTYTLQNSTGTSQLIGGLNIPSYALGPGDTTDILDPSRTTGDPGTCSSGVLAPNGGSCTFSETLVTMAGSGETDGDSGVTQFTMTASLCGSGCPSSGTILTLTTPITVTDPPIAPAPEPESIFLLSAGLLGLGPLLRRRFTRS
jgi:hypothetical protein